MANPNQYFNKSSIGKTCLITGANSGLGKAIAIDMANRGANVIMACRRYYSDALSEIRNISHNQNVSLRILDLSKLDNVANFCAQLQKDRVKLDITFINAGMASSTNCLSPDGYSLLWQVNYLSNVLLLACLLKNGVIQNEKYSQKKMSPNPNFIPRIIFTSSSRHRGELSIDFHKFGKFDDYSIFDTFKWYGLSKLYLMTYAWELGRQLKHKEIPEVSVHAFCPGPFRSRIGKGVGLLGHMAMSLIPTSPEKASWSAIHLGTSPNLEGKTLLYYHKLKEERPDPRVLDIKIAGRLWDETMKITNEFHSF